MLDTIPLKKNDSKKSHIARKNVNNHTSSSNQGGSLHGKVRLRPWILVLLVLGVVVTGILVYRSSQASTSGTGIIPQNITDIQNYIDSLSISEPNTKKVTTNNYAEFTYVPKTSESVKTVAYYIDGNIYTTSTKSPYSITVDTNRIANGEHQITAVAFNNQDVPVAAVQRNIIVSNNGDILRSINNVITYPWNWLFRL